MSDPKTSHPDPARCTLCRNTQQAPLAERPVRFTTYYFCEACLPRWQGQFTQMEDLVDA